MINKVIRRAKRAAVRLRNRYLDTTVVLLYHRVTDLLSDPQLLAVSPKNFSDHLAFLKATYPVISLQELSASFKKGEVPDKRVVITFDDGYADNLHFAKPLLDRHGLPATVFVTSGALASKKEFWWDELERLLLLPGTLSRTLNILIMGTDHSFDLRDFSHYRKEDYERFRHWNVLSKSDPTPRHTAYRSLMKALYLLPPREREAIISELQQRVGLKEEGRDTHLPLRSDEVRLLAIGGSIEIGAHTNSHARLSSLTVKEQREEIFSSKQSLEECLGLPVKSFSYPFGSVDAYTGETVAAVRDSGFIVSCSNFPGGVRQDADLFQLPRFLVRNWPVQEFETRLTGMFLE